jgi:hypothetical protein
MSLLRAFLLAQAIAATTKKHFKTSLSTLMDNAMQEDEALLKDKKEGDSNNKGTRSEVILNPVELMQSNVWSTFRSVASKNQCYDEMPNVLFRTEAAKAQLKGKNVFLVYFSLLSMGRSKIGTRSNSDLPFFVHFIQKITMPCLKHPCI